MTYEKLNKKSGKWSKVDADKLKDGDIVRVNGSEQKLKVSVDKDGIRSVKAA